MSDAQAAPAAPAVETEAAPQSSSFDLLRARLGEHGKAQETKVSDVFGLYRLCQDGDQAELEQVPLAHTFLHEPRFVSEFKELYSYYKNAQLIQLRTKVNCWPHSRSASAFLLTRIALDPQRQRPSGVYRQPGRARHRLAAHP